MNFYRNARPGILTNKSFLQDNKRENGGRDFHHPQQQSVDEQITRQGASIERERKINETHRKPEIT